MTIKGDINVDPKKMGRTSVIDISSHMSFLTNQRINEIKTSISELNYLAGINYDMDPIIGLGSAIDTYYKEVRPLLDDNHREKIDSLFSEFNEIKFLNKTTVTNRYKMFKICGVLQDTINDYLQKSQYLFRTESKIKGAVNILKSTGWFDGDGVQGVAEK